MVGKTNVGKGFGGCLRYNLDKVEEGHGEVLHKNNCISDDPKNLSKEFRAICDENRNISNPVWHTSLSFSKGDSVNNEKMTQIANDFMARVGFDKDNHQYIVIKHTDKDHSHVHIVANRVGFDGKAVSDFYYKNHTVSVCKKMEEDYSLVRVQEVHAQKVSSKDPKQKEIKETLQMFIDESLKGSKNLEEFARNMRYKGVDVDLKKHSQTDQYYGISFKYENYAFKGSEIGNKYKFNNLAKELGIKYQQSNINKNDRSNGLKL